jgi:hypothetical protein
MGATLLGCQAPGLVVQPPVDRLESFLVDARGTAPLEGTVVYSDATCVAPDWDALHAEESTLTWPTFMLATVPDLVRSHASLDVAATDSFVVVREPNFTEGLERDDPSVLGVTTWSGSADVECDGATIAGLPVIRTHFYVTGEPTIDEAFDAASTQADELGVAPVGDLDVAIAR